MFNDNTELDVREKLSYQERQCNRQFFKTQDFTAKVAQNTANIFGPAIVCLPFVVQKAGLLPTAIALLFLCFFSTFSSLCLSETRRLLNANRVHQRKSQDFTQLLDSLIQDKIFAYSSKFCVIIGYLLYSILCVITAANVADHFFVRRFAMFSFLPAIAQDNVQGERKISFTNYFYGLNPAILSNGKLGLLLVCFTMFAMLLVANRFSLLKKGINYLICFMAFVSMGALTTYASVHRDLFTKSKSISILGEDYTYLYGTIIFSFSYVSAVPGWLSESDVDNESQKKTLQCSAIIAAIAKVFFTIMFGLILTFGEEFSLSAYFNTTKGDHLYASVITLFGAFLLVALLNGVLNHTLLFAGCFKNESDDNYNLFTGIICVSLPWVLCLLLVVNGSIFLSLLNWSSIFIFGYVNFVLPLLLYIEAVEEVETFECNYKQSALLDFENFIMLKGQELSMKIIDENSDEDELKIQKIVYELRQKINDDKNNDIDEETKEKVVDLLYEEEGFYLISRSYGVLFGELLSSRNKVTILLYLVILCLMFFMFVSIYLALYNFFINKTLVVNIFIQTK